MKKFLLLIFIIFLLPFGCKDLTRNANKGNFRLINKSEKIVEFVWIAPEGEFFPTAKNVDIGNDQVYESEGLMPGVYDIAIDFHDEFNSFNSKKDKYLCLYIEKGLTTVWYVDQHGDIIRK